VIEKNTIKLIWLDCL